MRRKTGKRSNSFVDRTGMRYGKLTVLSLDLERTNESDNLRSYWNCICDCGIECSKNGTNLSQGGTRSCGCLAKRNRDASESNKKGFGVNTRNIVFLSYKRSAKRRKNKIDFNLSLEDFLVLTSQNCYYCGDIPQNIQKSKHNNGDFVYNGIDRVDNKIGYSVDNCVPCCKLCNYMKSVMKIEQFIVQSIKIANHNKWRNNA